MLCQMRTSGSIPFHSLLHGWPLTSLHNNKSFMKGVQVSTMLCVVGDVKYFAHSDSTSDMPEKHQKKASLLTHVTLCHNEIIIINHT